MATAVIGPPKLDVGSQPEPALCRPLRKLLVPTPLRAWLQLTPTTHLLLRIEQCEHLAFAHFQHLNNAFQLRSPWMHPAGLPLVDGQR